MQKLSEATNVSSELIRTTASLLFYAITTLKKYAPDELRGVVQEQSKELVHGVHKEIIMWMKRVYGSIFGSPVGTGIHLLLRANDELEVRFNLL